MDKAKVIVIRGVLNYAKVLGKARPHKGLKQYDKGPYWSVDVTPDAKSLDLIEALDLDKKLKKLKKPDANRVGAGKYLSFRVLENREDGEKNNPPRVVDARGNEWDGRLLGNGTVADVKVKVVDYGPGTQKGTYLQAIRVLKHVPYEANDFEPLSEDDEFFASPEDGDTEFTGPEDDEDDVPY